MSESQIVTQVSAVGGYVFFSSRRRHTRYWRDWSSDVCSSDLGSLISKATSPGDADEETSRGGPVTGPSRQVSSVSGFARSEEGRVGKEWRSRWSPDH